MAYSLIEQSSQDLDIFFSDGEKLIHFASAGGRIPDRLLNSDNYNQIVTNAIAVNSPNFEIEINPNLSEILGLNNQNLESYLTSFTEMAKKGFYSYDKTKIGEFDDQNFHLVAKPKSPLTTNTLFNTHKINVDMIKVEINLPKSFEVFDITKFV